MTPAPETPEDLAIYNYLASFLAAYKLKSVSKSAKQLKMTQPSVSGHIKNLENQLGGKLFVRNGRGIEPTDLAHKLASDLSPDWNRLEKIVGQYFKPAISEPEHLTTRLGCTSEIFEFLLFPAFDPKASDLRHLELTFSHTPVLFEKLMQNELDMVITSFQLDSDHFIRKEFFKTKQILVGQSARKQYFSSSNPLDSDLDRIPWGAYFSQQTILKKYLKTACNSTAIVSPKVTVNDARILLMYAERGDIVTVIPEFILKKYSGSSDLCQIHFPENYPTGCLFSYIKADSPDASIRMKQLADWKEIVKKIHPWPEGL